MKYRPLFAALITLTFVGAGCTAPAPAPSSQSPTLKAEPGQASAPAAKEAFEYRFFCNDAKKEPSDFKAILNPLLKRQGWSQIDPSGIVCTRNGSGDTALVITDDCTGGKCEKAGLILVNPPTKELKVVSTEGTGELLGSRIISEVLSWKPDEVTYRRLNYVIDGPCIESSIKDKVAYDDVEVVLSTGKKKVVKSCRLESCDSPGLNCTEQP